MKVTEYPKEIERAALDLGATCEEIAEVRDRLKDAELDALDSVINARGEDNRSLYSNDKARDIAIHRMLKDSRGYQQDKSTLRILEHKGATNEAEIERLRREYRIALIDYERQQLGRRDAA